MDTKTKKLALCAVLTALGLVLMLASALIPTGQLGFSAVCSLVVAVSITEAGAVYGLLVYVAAGVLGFFLSPDKSSALLFLLFFGYYPVVKHFSEKLPAPAAWSCKLLSCLTGVTLVLFAAGFSVRLPGIFSGRTALVYLPAAVLFVLFDIGYTKLWNYYRRVLSPKLHRGRT